MQNLIFCLHNVVLDTQKLKVFPFLGITFFKQAKNSYFFCMACLYMPGSISPNLKILILKEIIFNKNFAKF